MRKSNSVLSLFAIASSLSETGLDSGIFSRESKKVVSVKKEKRHHVPKPKGSKEYFFNRFGEFSTERMRKDETVFICIAINDYNAKRKFKRWQSNQKSDN